MAQTLREFNMAGPCIYLGDIVSNTSKAWKIIERSWPNETVKKLKRSKAAKCGLIHDEPCRSCIDHPESQYPNGYEN